MVISGIFLSSISFLISTDLASRGIDIPELKFIIHYEMSRTLEEYTHRNGRVGRVNSKGIIVLPGDKEYDTGDETVETGWVRLRPIA